MSTQSRVTDTVLSNSLVKHQRSLHGPLGAPATSYEYFKHCIIEHGADCLDIAYCRVRRFRRWLPSQLDIFTGLWIFRHLNNFDRQFNLNLSSVSLDLRVKFSQPWIRVYPCNFPMSFVLDVFCEHVSEIRTYDHHFLSEMDNGKHLWDHWRFPCVFHWRIKFRAKSTWQYFYSTWSLAYAIPVAVFAEWLKRHLVETPLSTLEEMGKGLETLRR